MEFPLLVSLIFCSRQFPMSYLVEQRSIMWHFLRRANSEYLWENSSYIKGLCKVLQKHISHFFMMSLPYNSFFSNLCEIIYSKFGDLTLSTCITPINIKIWYTGFTKIKYKNVKAVEGTWITRIYMRMWGRNCTFEQAKSTVKIGK